MAATISVSPNAQKSWPTKDEQAEQTSCQENVLVFLPLVLYARQLKIRHRFVNQISYHSETSASNHCLQWPPTSCYATRKLQASNEPPVRSREPTKKVSQQKLDRRGTANTYILSATKAHSIVDSARNFEPFNAKDICWSFNSTAP